MQLTLCPSREDALSLGGCLQQGVLAERVMAMCDTQARCDTLVGTQHSTVSGFPPKVCVTFSTCTGRARTQSSAFFHDPADVGLLISGSSAFSKPSLSIRKLIVHVLLKPGLDRKSVV